MQLRRDSQQWAFDWVVKETGRVFHFQGPGRGGLPPAVTMHAMISKHLGKRALQVARLAQAAESAGNSATALEYWFDASITFAMAQHVVFDNTPEKRFLHRRCLDAYDKVRALSPYPIERVRATFRDGDVVGNFHQADVQEEAPCVVVIPGCDMTKEMYPHPYWNHARQRGMHVVVIDGPGQGESNLAGIALRSDNYELAVAAIVKEVATRPDVDAQRIALYGASFGSLWALRAAKSLPELGACVASWASVGKLRHLLDEESPRYKQLFAYLTQAADEDELDQTMAQMELDQLPGAITCPTLMTVGEYDPRSPLDEVEAVFADLRGPAELWVFEDQHHMCSVSGRPVTEMTIWQHDSFASGMDWICRAVAGQVHEQTKRRIGAGGVFMPPSDNTITYWFNEQDN